MANTVAYYDMATITAVKSFVVQAPGEAMSKGIMARASSYLVHKSQVESLNCGHDRLRQKYVL